METAFIPFLEGVMVPTPLLEQQQTQKFGGS
jgi:hypothetical protein